MIEAGQWKEVLRQAVRTVKFSPKMAGIADRQWWVVMSCSWQEGRSATKETRIDDVAVGMPFEAALRQVLYTGAYMSVLVN